MSTASKTFKPGQRVTFSNKKGTVRFFGTVSFQPGTWVGIELDSAEGKNDGEVQGTRYFTCPPNYGVFVKPVHCTLISEEAPQAETASPTTQRKTATTPAATPKLAATSKARPSVKTPATGKTEGAPAAGPLEGVSATGGVGGVSMGAGDRHISSTSIGENGGEDAGAQLHKAQYRIRELEREVQMLQKKLVESAQSPPAQAVPTPAPDTPGASPAEREKWKVVTETLQKQIEVLQLDKEILEATVEELRVENELRGQDLDMVRMEKEALQLEYAENPLQGQIEVYRFALKKLHTENEALRERAAKAPSREPKQKEKEKEGAAAAGAAPAKRSSDDGPKVVVDHEKARADAAKIDGLRVENESLQKAVEELLSLRQLDEELIGVNGALAKDIQLELDWLEQQETKHLEAIQKMATERAEADRILSAFRAKTTSLEEELRKNKTARQTIGGAGALMSRGGGRPSAAARASARGGSRAAPAGGGASAGAGAASPAAGGSGSSAEEETLADGGSGAEAGGMETEGGFEEALRLEQRVLEKSKQMTLLQLALVEGCVPASIFSGASSCFAFAVECLEVQEKTALILNFLVGSLMDRWVRELDGQSGGEAEAAGGGEGGSLGLGFLRWLQQTAAEFVKLLVQLNEFTAGLGDADQKTFETVCANEAPKKVISDVARALDLFVLNVRRGTLSSATPTSEITGGAATLQALTKRVFPEAANLANHCDGLSLMACARLFQSALTLLVCRAGLNPASNEVAQSALVDVKRGREAANKLLMRVGEDGTGVERQSIPEGAAAKQKNLISFSTKLLTELTAVEENAKNREKMVASQKQLLQGCNGCTNELVEMLTGASRASGAEDNAWHRLSTSVSKKLGDVENMENAVKEKQKELDAANNRDKERMTEISTLREQAQELRTRLGDALTLSEKGALLQTECESLRAQAKFYVQELDTSRAALANAQTTCDTAVKESTEAKKKLQDLRDEVDKKAKARKAALEFGGTGEELTGLRAVCQRLGREAFRSKLLETRAALQPVYLSKELLEPLPDSHPLAVGPRILASQGGLRTPRGGQTQRSEKDRGREKERGDKTEREDLSKTRASIAPRSQSRRTTVGRSKSSVSKSGVDGADKTPLFEGQVGPLLCEDPHLLPPHMRMNHPEVADILDCLREYRDMRRAWLLKRASASLVDLEAVRLEREKSRRQREREAKERQAREERRASKAKASGSRSPSKSAVLIAAGEKEKDAKGKSKEQEKKEATGADVAALAVNCKELTNRVVGMLRERLEQTSADLNRPPPPGTFYSFPSIDVLRQILTHAPSGTGAGSSADAGAGGEGIPKVESDVRPTQGALLAARVTVPRGVLKDAGVEALPQLAIGGAGGFGELPVQVRASLDELRELHRRML
uniref:CAP-Gly domain-containing protein n=1 Tax=Chromera velia CCMP2878 TaxID=1169474 RepID=A0A0G4I3X7_9ALVE|eukprot:Cvel_1773.t1-p1 / transcript=Cvel_1773.t1 / gene=Cvel_1773 / organism=Chromera_velia_CCMP2878 / gene_product=Dynactin subunit 1, putative / transcript_product=Dynactin subunit 1, putative / location=Cvel_scaffold65:32231-43486(+) / protein_length=1392 / sequence_SO=supercontig / SO=protein_coding / is_pseudo=false